MISIYRLNILSALMVTFLLVSCEKEDPNEIITSKIDIGQKEIQIYTGGNGNNTVVFESGLGEDGTTWFNNKLINTVVANNQAIAYNRAGYTPSTLIEGEARDLEALAADLGSVINIKSKNDKVILVGHSLGGAVIRAYAIKNPDKVSALLFIDPSHEGYIGFSTITQEQADAMSEQLNNDGKTGAALEVKKIPEDILILQSLPNLPDVPVIVITSMKLEGEVTAEQKQNLYNAHETLGEDITDFTHLQTTVSGHYIYLDEPQLVIDQINELLNKST